VVCVLADGKVNTLDKDQQLVVASFELDVCKVRRLLAEGANPDARIGNHDETLFEDKWTLGYPIAAAAWTPLLAVANSHSAPQPASRAENTPRGLDAARKKLSAINPKLIRECDGRRVEIAKLLIAAKANLDLDDGHGATALSASVYEGYEPLSLLLISKGANVNTKTHVYIDGPDNITPVHRATGQPAVLEAMIKHGAKVNVQDSEGRTPLHRAALHQSAKSVKLLLAAGADPDTKDNEGRTPAYWCKTYNGSATSGDAENREILKLLSEAKTKK
jgi:hypothetical protein